MLSDAPRRHRKQFRSAETPFAQALTEAIQAAGYPNRRVFAERLGLPRPTVTEWTRGTKVPSPGAFGRILQVLQPADAQLDALVEPWSELLRRRLKCALEREFQVSLRRRGPARTPLGQWIDAIADARHWSISGFARRLGVDDLTLHNWRRSAITPLAVLTFLRHAQRGPLVLSDREQDALRQAIAETIAEQAASDRGPAG